MNYPDAHVHSAVLIDHELVFENNGSLHSALQQGLFLLKVPEGIDLQAGIKLCREFYLPANAHTRYRGLREHTDIYFDREHFQTEHLLVEKPHWAAHLPDAVVQMAQAMDAMGQVVFQAALREIGVAQPLWQQLSGGAVTGQGTHWFAASHYRPERRLPGCAEHRDTGFVTLLYTPHSGLEAFIEGQWQSVAAPPGCFIVNFGACLEMLSGRLQLPVRAIEHRVRECAAVPGSEDRFSFATFINPPASADLYELQPEGDLLRLMSVEAFLRHFNEFTWQDRYAEFGIESGQPRGATDE